MRKAIRILVYALVIFGAYRFFNWFRSDHDQDDHHEKVEVHVHHQSDGERLSTGSIRVLESFEAISINGVFEVDLRQGDESSVKIESDKGQMDQILTQVHNDRLVISTRSKNWKFKDQVRLIITSPSITEISVGGGVELESQTPIEGDYLKIYVSGTADLDLDVKLDDLEMTLSGAANAELRGTTEIAKFNVSGAGHIEADRLVASDVKIGLSGAGAMSVHATESLDVGISGAGSVTYKGNPHLTKRVSGLGIVRQE